MATEFKLVTPTDLGNTLKLGAQINGKYDLNLKPEDFTVGADGQVAIKLDRHIKSAALVNKNLVIKREGLPDLTADLSGLIPPVKADVFLSAVSYDSSTKSLILTVSNGIDEGVDKVITVSIADLVPVTAGDGLEGDGTGANPVKAKVVPTGHLKVSADGLEIDDAKTIVLKNAAGNITLGKILTA